MQKVVPLCITQKFGRRGRCLEKTGWAGQRVNICKRKGSEGRQSIPEKSRPDKSENLSWGPGKTSLQNFYKGRMRTQNTKCELMESPSPKQVDTSYTVKLPFLKKT